MNRPEAEEKLRRALADLRRRLDEFEQALGDELDAAFKLGREAGREEALDEVEADGRGLP